MKALVAKVEETWSLYDSSVFQHIFERWVKVLQLVIIDNGNNNLVDSHQGVHFLAADNGPNADDDESSE